MRTSSRSSAARFLEAAFDRRWWVVKMSTIWSPTVITGLSAFIADWNTIATWLHRKERSSAGSMARTSRPRTRIEPLVITAGSRSRRMIEWATVLFPQPDSPASPKISPAPMWKLTLSTARTVRRSPRYSIERSVTSSTGSSADTSVVVFIVFPPLHSWSHVGAVSCAAADWSPRRRRS